MALTVEQVVDGQATGGGLLERADGGVQARAGGGADGGVLIEDEPHRLRRPRQQLAVEDDPVGAELLPQPGRVGGRPDAGEGGLGVVVVVEERAPGARVERARSPVSTPKRSRATPASRQTTAIAREPMCFS